MKKLQFIDIGKPFRIIGKICKDIERAFRFKGINVNFIVMMIDYIGFAFILKWNLQSDNEKYEVTNLRDFLYAKDNGYYSNTTIGIREESYLDSMITVLNLLENARNNFYKPTKVKFIDLIQSLPATLLDFSTPPEEESELKGKSIKDLLKENKVQINKDSLDGIFVELLDNSFDSESCLHHKAGSLFSQLYRADFNGDGKEEILFSVHCFSGGTLNTVKTLCLGYRSFLGIWKKWDLIDIDKIHIEHYSNIFPSEWQN